MLKRYPYTRRKNREPGKRLSPKGRRREEAMPEEDMGKSSGKKLMLEEAVAVPN